MHGWLAAQRAWHSCGDRLTPRYWLARTCHGGRAKSRMRPTCVGFGRRAGVAMTVPPSAHPSDTWTGRVGGVRKRRSPSAAERLEDRPAAERVSTSSWAMAAVTISTASHSLARRNHGAVPHDALDDGGSGLVG